MKSAIVLLGAAAAVATDTTTSSATASSSTASTESSITVAPSSGGQVVDNNCTSLHYIYARGTAEPATPYGIVGNALFNATKALIPDLSGYGVKYPADLDCQSRQMGGANTVAHLKEQHALCPSQKFVLAGISQGADVIHFAAGNAPSELYPSIIAIALFGDPGHRGTNAIDPLGDAAPAIPAELASKLKQSCAHNDPVCSNNGTILTQHAIYANANETYLSASADYIKRQFDSNGQAGPEPSSEGPGEQTEGNIQAILELSNILAGVGVKQTCNGTTTSYIHPDLLATATSPASGSGTSAATAAASTTATEASASASASASTSSSGQSGALKMACDWKSLTMLLILAIGLI